MEGKLSPTGFPRLSKVGLIILLVGACAVIWVLRCLVPVTYGAVKENKYREAQVTELKRRYEAMQEEMNVKGNGFPPISKAKMFFPAGVSDSGDIYLTEVGGKRCLVSILRDTRYGTLVMCIDELGMTFSHPENAIDPTPQELVVKRWAKPK